MDKLIKKAIEGLRKDLDVFVSSLPDDRVKEIFDNCFYNTLTTTVKIEERDAFVITGDIPAMWLRDSSAQINHYLPFVKSNEALKEIIARVIKRQMECICYDPYANAFNREENGQGHRDQTKLSRMVWERKYEIDSLCYPLILCYDYYKATGDKDIFDVTFLAAVEKILLVFETEQYHEEKSRYRFQRFDCSETDTLKRDGLGTTVTYTGMTWSGFRPSDDACNYGYLVPSNMMACVALQDLEIIALEVLDNEALCIRAKNLRLSINQGITKYGIVKHPKFGHIYCYETDGLGNHALMDDANVPSLMSTPYFGYVEKDEPVYQNTRAFLLSKENPYYYEGSYCSGIGSPHTPEGYVWHIALAMQGLTAKTQDEKREIMEYILATDNGNCYMHEGFNPNDPSEFTRPWFAWANSIVSEFMLDVYGYNQNNN